MFVVNFDFSTFDFLTKLVAINLPVVITELITYPLQRIQTQLIKRQQFITKNQFNQIRLLMKEMISIEKYPKLLHGVRYSLDYSITQMTTKFFLFDNLMVAEIADTNKYFIYFSCFCSNIVATLFSQSAFNYMTITSSLPPDKNNRNQSVRLKLIEYTSNRKVPLIGLQYTIPVSIFNTALELALIWNIKQMFKKQAKKSEAISNELTIDSENYMLTDFTTAVIALLATTFSNHFAMIRQVELCFKLKERIPYTKGLLGTLFRNTSKGFTLFSIYYLYFEHKTKSQISSEFQKRPAHNQLPAYQQNKGHF